MYKIVFSFLIVMFSCSENKRPAIKIGQTYPWCIVPFDVKKRTPEARIQMLQDLGFTEYAYDWREAHLSEMGREWKLAKAKGIGIRAVWMWIDDDWDKVEKLNANNERILNTLKETGLETQIWVSFHANFFDDLEDEAAVEKGKEMIQYLAERAKSVNCKVGLYNHGDWFGEPKNQIEILKALPEFDLGLIYNFHHGYNQVEGFSKLVDIMLPFLWSVNLSGVKKGDKSIYQIGQGNHEKEMLEVLLEKGYTKSFGILGHKNEEDVAVVLKGNLEGLFSIQNSNK